MFLHLWMSQPCGASPHILIFDCQDTECLVSPYATTYRNSVHASNLFVYFKIMLYAEQEANFNQRQSVMQCRQAAQCFIGSHDFTQFANTYPFGINPQKTLTRFDVIKVGSDLLRLEVEASGFLYKMVRHMVRSI